MTTGTIRIGLAQPRVIVDPNPEANVARATTMVARAAAYGADDDLFTDGGGGPGG